MHSSKLDVLIKNKFELGYLIDLPDGRQGQLRVLEMKDQILECHLRGREERVFGETLEAYIIEDSDEALLLSQFSPQERNERELLQLKRREARENSEIGDILLMRVTKETKFQYTCEQVDGYLEVNISKKVHSLNVGEEINAKITGKSISGIPELELISEQATTK